MNDAEIVARFWSRDADAVAAAEAVHGAFCRTLARNILGSDEDAEECVNDALFSAWNAIPPEKPRSLRAYLGKLTRNHALNRLERSRAGKRGGGAADAVLDELAEVLGVVSSAEDEVMERELIRTINAFLGSLDPGRRLLFVRRYWYGESVGSLAARLGMGENAVSAALRRIRLKLKNYLKREGYGV